MGDDRLEVVAVAEPLGVPEAAGQGPSLDPGIARGAAGKELDLARTLVGEENRDRAEVWRRIIDANANLSTKDLPEVRKTYAKMQRDAAGAGQWYQDEAGRWQQKAGG